jgi:hypothetical protein
MSRIYQSGRDNFLEAGFKSHRRTELSRPPSLGLYPMAAIALVTLGLLGDGFMIYALFHWMRDNARRRK